MVEFTVPCVRWMLSAQVLSAGKQDGTAREKLMTGCCRELGSRTLSMFRVVWVQVYDLFRV